MMELLTTHWHCIVPIIAIGIGMYIMNRKKSGEDDE
jgi:cadmium resistance protein CadD (predicted permease)